MKRLATLSFVTVLVIAGHAAQANELDDLEALSDSNATSKNGGQGLQDLEGLESGGLDDLSETLVDAPVSETDDEEKQPGLSLQINGYVKPLVYWGSQKFSDAAWKTINDYRTNGITIPYAAQSSSQFSNVGTRMQLRMEGYVDDVARVYTAFNLDYNEVASSQNSTHLVESYVEFFLNNGNLKVGNQLVTWGYMEGLEVPTDRISAFDYEYASTEYEDSKQASTGVRYQYTLGDFSGLDLIVIPVSKVHNITADQDYFYSEKQDVFPTKDSSNMKTGLRYFNTIGDLDFALSYVEGIDPALDAKLLHNQTDAQGNSNDALQRSYNREKSPGLDLQYNFGSMLGKLAYAAHYTSDKDGSDAAIKNSWHHLAIGAEFNVGSSIVNLYGGTKIVENIDASTNDRITTNLLMGQAYPQVNFLSGHATANFLTGDALSTTILFAAYWNGAGKVVQYVLRPALTYKLADTLKAQFSPSFIDVNDTAYQALQFEVQYVF